MQYVGCAIVTGAHWLDVGVAVILREAIARSTRAVVMIIEAIVTRVARISSAAVGITVVTDLASFLGRRALATGRDQWQCCDQSKHKDEPPTATTRHHHDH